MRRSQTARQSDGEISRRAAGVRVRVTLVCGWCARRFYDIDGLVNVELGRLRVGSTATVGHRGGRLVCLHCQGPLFLDEWRRFNPSRAVTGRNRSRDDGWDQDEISAT